jgi:hypothetical protein
MQNLQLTDPIDAKPKKIWIAPQLVLIGVDEIYGSKNHTRYQEATYQSLVMLGGGNYLINFDKGNTFVTGAITREAYVS